MELFPLTRKKFISQTRSIKSDEKNNRKYDNIQFAFRVYNLCMDYSK